MSILRLKAVIVTILIFLLPHHTPNGLLTSVITLAFTGKQLSPFTVFTLLLGLTFNQGDILLQFEHVYAVSGRC